MTDNKHGYELPQEIAPPTITFCIEVPDDDIHLRAFWGALWTLTRWYNWGFDEDETAIEVARYWRDLWFKNHELFRDRDCGVPSERCSTYDYTDARITFYPTVEATELPLGYVVNPWVKIEAPNVLVGLKTGDLITDLARMPPLPSIWDHLEDIGTILSLGYPSISIENLIGRGTVKIALLNVLLGGRAIIVKDNDLLSIAFLDTNLDTASLPPETYTENIIEYTFENSGTHRIDIVFVPNVSADIEFLGYGGGVRRLEICGFEENSMPTEACCDETNDLLKKIIRLMESGITGTFNFGGSTSSAIDIKVDCTPEKFDGNTDDTPLVAVARATALCVTVSRYIVACLYNLAVATNAGTTIKTNLKTLITPLALPNDFTSQLIAGGVPSTENPIPVDLDIVALSHLATDYSTLVDEIICEMLTSLTGKQNTFSLFKTSVVDAIAPTDTESNYRWLLHRFILWSNEIRENFITFSKQLEAAFVEVNEGLTYECPCYSGDCDADNFVLVSNNGCTLTKIDATHWRVQQSVSVPDGSDPDYRIYTAIVRDQFYRCVRYTGATQFETGYDQYTCSGVHQTGAGGGGGDLIQLGFYIRVHSSDTTELDTILTIACI
jgi:hypothetical protein